MINVVCGIRSTGRICTDLADLLEKKGNIVKIAFGREKVPEEFLKYAVRIGSDLDIVVHGVKARCIDGCGWGSKRATLRFVEWVKEYDPDIIHIHNLHGYYINIEILFEYLKTCGKKIIWTLHDCWAFTGHSAYCDMVECERWITGCYNCPNKSKYPKSFLDRSSQNWHKKKDVMVGIPNLKIITPSEWLAGLVKESFLAQYPVSVINNGIDTNLFKYVNSDFKQNYNINNKFMLLGVASVWNEMKGYSDYLKLADILGSEYQVVLVGVTKKQIRALHNNIIGIERTNSINELVRIYSAADLFINLSYCENYPTVNLEAIACGTAVLTYNSGGSIESAKGGFVVDRGLIEGVVDKILQFKKVKPVPVFDRNTIDYRTTLDNYLREIGDSL